MNRKKKLFANKIFETNRDTLVMKHHFLSFALYALEGVGIHDTEFRGLKYATEGKHYYYDEDEIIKDFMFFLYVKLRKTSQNVILILLIIQK